MQSIFLNICYTCPEGVALCICTCRQNDSEWFFPWRPCGFYTTVSPNKNTLAESIKLSVYTVCWQSFSHKKQKLYAIGYTALQLYIDLHNLQLIVYLNHIYQQHSPSSHRSGRGFTAAAPLHRSHLYGRNAREHPGPRNAWLGIRFGFGEKQRNIGSQPSDES